MEQDIQQLLSDTQKLKESNKELEATLLKLQQTFEKLTIGVSKSSKAYQDGIAVLKKIETSLKSSNDEIGNQLKMLERAGSAATKSAGQLNTLAAQHDNLRKAQQIHSAEITKLNGNFETLGQTVEQQASNAEKNSEGFAYLDKLFEAVNSSLESLKASAGEFSPQLESVMSGFNMLKTGLDVAKDGFTGVGAALKATGFGILMLILESLTEYFSKDKVGINKFKAILAGLSVILEKVKTAFSVLGGAIVNAVLHPGETAKKLWNGFVENIGNRFKAFGVILDGVMHLNPKKITDGVLQLSTGVTNATDKIKAAYKAVKEEVVSTGLAAEAAAKKVYKDLNAKPKAKSSGKKKLKAVTGRRKEEITRSPQIQQVSLKFLSPVEQERKAYEAELALLDEKLKEKLMTEEEYYLQRESLQKKFHQNLTTVLSKIDDSALKELVEKNRLEKEIQRDEKNKKSILPWKQHDAEKKLIEDKYAYEILQAKGNADKIKELETQKQADLTAVNEKYEQQRKEFALNTAQQVADKAFAIIGSNIKANSDAKIKGLEKDKAAELNNKNLTSTQRKAIEDKYQKKENQEKVKAFKAEQKAQIAQAVINGALAITKATSQTGVLAPFVIPGIIASTALQVATIISQKPPAYAKGGHFVSDGRGALLPGYSRTDNTNAYLRSGEAVVVSEAMRNPWARNLVSAINVAHGGRDFSVPNTGRGYAIGGIFTDGGNANRYYNQPVNDAKELANTLAYQMINNFPPIYVDVKDVNNQQSILAQTVNRVNL